MNDVDRRFVQDGISRYLEACSTVAHFQKLVEQELLAVAKARRSWGRFTASEIKVQSSRSRQPDQYIAAYAIGTLDGKSVSAEFGFWWGQPDAPTDAVAFAGFSDGPSAVQRFEYRRAKRDGYVAFEASRTYIAKPITSASDLSSEAKDILDELLAAAGIAK